MDQHEFVGARQRFWKEMVERHERDLQSNQEEPFVGTNFVAYTKGQETWFAVFEDDGDSGYLYLYDSEQRRVCRFLHVYDRSDKLKVMRDDVQVLWSDNGAKCAVAIWGKMRGIIDLRGREGRVWLEDRNTPGIGDQEWLKGFGYPAQ